MSWWGGVALCVLPPGVQWKAGRLSRVGRSWSLASGCVLGCACPRTLVPRQCDLVCMFPHMALLSADTHQSMLGVTSDSSMGLLLSHSKNQSTNQQSDMFSAISPSRHFLGFEFYVWNCDPHWVTLFLVTFGFLTFEMSFIGSRIGSLVVKRWDFRR